jgi:hypothetical protein
MKFAFNFSVGATKLNEKSKQIFFLSDGFQNPKKKRKILPPIELWNIISRHG